MKKIDLHSYTIFFEDAASRLHSMLAELSYTSLFVLVDENTKRDCLPLLSAVLPQDTKYIEIQSGELQKNIQTCEQIWQSLLEQGADRHSILVNLGGGVIGDMGGFSSATYMRGIRFVQVPTTLLSQVDASVGSKLGVDFQQAKNMVGLFQDPFAVIIDPTFLQTLPLAELRSGYAEVIKHALIKDESLWRQLLEITSVEEVASWEDIIYRSVQIKQEVVAADPREKGLRKILNFGHTIGHALESHFLDTKYPLLHGEAVAWGMYAEAALSHQQDKISAAALKEIQEYIHLHYSLSQPQQWTLHDLILLMQKDKKNHNQKISISLLEGIGSCTPDHLFDSEELEKHLGDLLS